MSRLSLALLATVACTTAEKPVDTSSSRAASHSPTVGPAAWLVRPDGVGPVQIGSYRAGRLPQVAYVEGCG